MAGSPSKAPSVRASGVQATVADVVELERALRQLHELHVVEDVRRSLAQTSQPALLLGQPQPQTPLQLSDLNLLEHPGGPSASHLAATAVGAGSSSAAPPAAAPASVLLTTSTLPFPLAPAAALGLSPSGVSGGGSGSGSNGLGFAMLLSPHEAEELSFQKAWLAYVWGRAALGGVLPQVSWPEAEEWAYRLERSPSPHDAQDLVLSFEALQLWSIEQLLWHKRYR